MDTIKKDFISSLKQTLTSAFKKTKTAPFKAPLKSILKQDSKQKVKEKEGNFRFNETVLVGEAFSPEEYDRKGAMKIHMTPTMAYLIRQELNEFKKEMAVHVESEKNTHFYF